MYNKYAVSSECFPLLAFISLINCQLVFYMHFHIFVPIINSSGLLITFHLIYYYSILIFIRENCSAYTTLLYILFHII